MPWRRRPGRWPPAGGGSWLRMSLRPRCGVHKVEMHATYRFPRLSCATYAFAQLFMFATSWKPES